MSKILVTGGTGKLATELKKILEADYVGIEHWDFTYDIQVGNPLEYDLVIHMGAWTDIVKGEIERNKCFETNVNGTWRMVDFFKEVPFVYISTEYASHPELSVYALSKQLGEEIVKTHPCHLILRTSFKPRPWAYDYAYDDQWTIAGYTDEIAEELALMVGLWDRKKSQFTYMGTGRKKMIDLARKTKPDVKPNKVADYKYGYLIPTDYQ